VDSNVPAELKILERTSNDLPIKFNSPFLFNLGIISIWTQVTTCFYHMPLSLMHAQNCLNGTLLPKLTYLAFFTAQEVASTEKTKYFHEPCETFADNLTLSRMLRIYCEYRVELRRSAGLETCTFFHRIGFYSCPLSCNKPS
jgi:hypothetical protein